ncbi:VOC family protein [Streptomyces sp. JNUCC 64]
MARTDDGSPTVYPTLLYGDARAAITLLTEAFGFTAVHVYEDGEGLVTHAELALGNGAVMLGSRGRGGRFDEVMAGGGPSGTYVVVEDVDAHHRRAVEHGVRVLVPPTDQDYGSRDYLALDHEGNVWSFGTYSPDLGG